MTADSIEINWVSPDTTSLYWSGSFTRPPPPTATLGPARDTRTKCRRACSPHRTTPKISSMKTVKSPTRPARWAPQPPFTSRSSKNHPYNPPPPRGWALFLRTPTQEMLYINAFLRCDLLFRCKSGHAKDVNQNPDDTCT